MRTAPITRDAFALDAGMVYLNHAAAGVLPIVTRDAIVTFANDHAARGIVGVAPYELKLDGYRAAIGALIGATGEEIAVLRNTGDGANIIAHGFDWQPGDEIVTQDNEFGANALPWLALRERGVVVRFIDTKRERMTPEALQRMMTPRTKLVAVSWVTFSDGYRHDLSALAEVAHRAGAWFVVDAIQALGAFPLDVADGIDALYAGGAKWLMSLQGVSFLYVGPRLLERLSLRIPGWRSLENMWDFLDYEQQPAASVARFEGGTPNFVGALSLATSIDFLRAANINAIGEHLLSLTDYLVDRLQSLGAEIASVRTETARSGIVTFTLPGNDPVALGQRLQSAGVVTTYRPTGIRVSPHGHNTNDDIDALIAAIRE